MKLYVLVLMLATVCIPAGHSIAALGQKAGVLEIEVISGRQKHHRIATNMTRTLRSVIRGQRRWRDVGKLSATLSDAREAFGCEPQNIACMQGLAQTLGVNVLVWGVVDGTGPIERIKLWGVSTDGKRKYLDLPLNDSSPYVEYRSSAKTLLSAIIKRDDQTTRVKIQTEPKGAIVQVNGENVGLSPVVLMLRKGSYKVEVSLEGYDLLDKTLLVKRTETIEKNWLLRSTSYELPAQNHRPTSLRKTVRWSALGVALTSLAVTVYFTSEAQLLTDQNKERLKCNNGTFMPQSQCGSSGSIQLIYEQEYQENRRAYQNSKFMMIGSLVVTSIAASAFGASFVF